MSLGNFMRTQLFSAFSPVKIGMDVMTKDEGVAVDSLVGHGGIFTTPKVAQKILAAAFDTPIKVMATAAEGGAWGMAVLADYLWHADQPLADYLDTRVFADAASPTEATTWLASKPSSTASARGCRSSMPPSKASRWKPNNRPS